VQEICTLGSAWGDEFKKPRSLGEGTGAKASDNSEAPQRATASRLVSTIRVAVLGPARAAAFLYLSPLFSAALSIGWLCEQLAWYHIAGIAAIFSGLIILGKSGPARERDRLESELVH
jgi:hypothetical protein